MKNFKKELLIVIKILSQNQRDIKKILKKYNDPYLLNSFDKMKSRNKEVITALKDIYTEKQTKYTRLKLNNFYFHVMSKYRNITNSSFITYLNQFYNYELHIGVDRRYYQFRGGSYNNSNNYFNHYTDLCELAFVTNEMIKEFKIPDFEYFYQNRIKGDIELEISEKKYKNIYQRIYKFRKIMSYEY